MIYYLFIYLFIIYLLIILKCRIVTQDCLKSAEIKDILAYEFVRKYFSNDIMKTVGFISFLVYP